MQDTTNGADNHDAVSISPQIFSGEQVANLAAAINEINQVGGLKTARWLVTLNFAFTGVIFCLFEMFPTPKVEPEVTAEMSADEFYSLIKSFRSRLDTLNYLSSQYAGDSFFPIWQEEHIATLAVIHALSKWLQNVQRVERGDCMKMFKQIASEFTKAAATQKEGEMLVDGGVARAQERTDAGQPTEVVLPGPW